MFNRSLATAALALCIGTGTLAAEELSFASFTPPAHTVTAAVIEPFSAAVAAAGADITVRAYLGGELGPGPAEQYARVVQGVADVAWGLPGNNSAQFPLTMIAELPGVVEQIGWGKAHEGLARAYDEFLKPEFVATRALALWSSEPSVLIMKDRDIRTPADLAGLKIRVSGIIPAQVVTSLGATPVQMPASEMYNALQTGLVDGILTGSSAILDFKLNEVASSYTSGASLGNVLFYTVMSEARYQGLTDAQKAAVDAASGLALSKSGEAGWNAKGAVALETLRADASKRVIDLTADEAAPFNAITVGLADQIIADLDAKGLPATAARAAMLGN